MIPEGIPNPDRRALPHDQGQKIIVASREEAADPSSKKAVAAAWLRGKLRPAVSAGSAQPLRGNGSVHSQQAQAVRRRPAGNQAVAVAQSDRAGTSGASRHCCSGVAASQSVGLGRDLYGDHHRSSAEAAADARHTKAKADVGSPEAATLAKLVGCADRKAAARRKEETQAVRTSQ